MFGKLLDNSIRFFRRRAGLSQDELAFLLGKNSGTFVCRIESGRRSATLETLLAFEAIFGVPLHELYPGRFRKVEETVKERAELLARKISQSGRPRKRALSTLTAIIEREWSYGNH